MKTLWINLCAGLFLTAISARAQSADGGRPTPLLLVYVAAQDDDVLPRIALGTEKPALTIDAFEKCVRVSSFNGQQGGIAVLLKPDDAKTLADVIGRLDAASPTNPHTLHVYFASPDNRVLGFLNTSGSTKNLADGILSFADGGEREIVGYLTEKLHPK